jgi:hypothetical protein
MHHDGGSRTEQAAPGRRIVIATVLRPEMIMMAHRIVAGTGMDTIGHGDRVYAAHTPDEVSGYRPHLEIPLRLIAFAARDHAARIIDVARERLGVRRRR